VEDLILVLLFLWLVWNLISRVSTYSVTFPEFQYSESYFQQLIVSKFGTIHHEIISTNRNFTENFIYPSSMSDTPLLIPNYTQIFQLAQLAKEKVKVLITGEGADEIFGGYGIHLLPWKCGLGYL
jgi:asparagine synthase (glutamine-hydrolysing)